MPSEDTLPPPNRSTADWPAIARSAAERLLGEPTWHRSSKAELRWGNRGSFSLNLGSGRWRDFEAGTRGGALDLVQRETGLDRAGAVSWLREQGLLDDNRSGQPPLQTTGDPAGEKRAYSVQMARTCGMRQSPSPPTLTTRAPVGRRATPGTARVPVPGCGPLGACRRPRPSEHSTRGPGAWSPCWRPPGVGRSLASAPYAHGGLPG